MLATQGTGTSSGAVAVLASCSCLSPLQGIYRIFFLSCMLARQKWEAGLAVQLGRMASAFLLLFAALTLLYIWWPGGAWKQFRKKVEWF